MTVACPGIGLIECAVDWHVRSMARETDQALWPAYADWLSADPAHAEAARIVDQLLADLERGVP